ncbi:MAG: DHH family phosphoesterase, partial [Planctomycetes bacterium]|nr:DHH family phosphoesterase [Planctomycetota bacterium]
MLVARSGWHEGVIGIVAGRLSEIYGKPAAVISFPTGQDKGRGSARSINGLNLYQAMANSREHLLTFGGHELAAGFTVSQSSVEQLKKSFFRECAMQIKKHNITRTLDIDMEIRLADVNFRLVEELEMLRPVGQGNPEPKFLARGVKAAGSIQLMGCKRHLFHFIVAHG